MKKRVAWTALGCGIAAIGVLVVAVAGVAALVVSVAGVSVAGFSLGTWLVAVLFVAATTPDPLPSHGAWLQPGSTSVVSVTGDATPQVTIYASVPADGPLSGPGGRVVVFVRAGEAPSAESLAALPRAPVYQLGQVHAGVGEVAALGEAPLAFGSAGGPSLPNLRLDPRGGFVTVLVLDEPTYVKVAADVRAMERECQCEPQVRLAAVP